MKVYMDMNKGYIYIRNNESYNKYNICKLDITTNLYNRHSTYKTNEIICGNFILIIQIDKSKLNILDKLLKYHFRDYHYYINGGTDFYKTDIILLIEPYLKTLNLNFELLSNDRIKRLNKLSNIFNKINIINLINILKYSVKNNNQIIIPNQLQIDVLLKIKYFYENNINGKIIHPCGCGKTILSILITKQLNCKLVLICVPNVF